MNKKVLPVFLIVSQILIPIILISLPKTYFNEGKVVCISKLLLNKSCPGCGLTRACQHIIHFDFSTAWEFNKLAFIVFPILVFLYVSFFIKQIKKIQTA